MLKKIVTSKWLRFGISGLLIYLAFRKVDVVHIFQELIKVPWWFMVGMIVYSLLSMAFGAYRWSLLLFDRPGWKEVWRFAKACYAGAFYGLVFPTGVAGDLLKWLPLRKHYPELSKVQLLGSVLIDRVIGFSAFIFVAFVSAVAGKYYKISFPEYLIWIFGLMFVGVVTFFMIVLYCDVESLIVRFKGKIPFIDRLERLVFLLKHESKNRLLKCFVVAFVSEFTWLTPIWFTSLVFGAGMSLLSVYIIAPVVALILVLPISMAGFGPREGIYLFFFTQIGLNPEKVLMVSTFNGIMGVIMSLMGGLMLLF